jgi:hypothetical protein
MKLIRITMTIMTQQSHAIVLSYTYTLYPRPCTIEFLSSLLKLDVANRTMLQIGSAAYVKVAIAIMKYWNLLVNASF